MLFHFARRFLTRTSVLLTFATPAFAQVAPVSVQTAFESQVMNRVNLTGSVVSQRSAEISTDIGGLVSATLVEIGDRVDTGDVLIQLDPALEQLELQRGHRRQRRSRSPTG